MDAALFAGAGVCNALHTAARVDAAPFSAVRVGVMLPVLLLLVMLLGYMLTLSQQLV